MEVKAPSVKLHCPSCQSEMLGAYCHQCGEKVYNKDELRLTVFAKDAFHELSDVDSKLLKTFYFLVFRPGFLTLEAMSGKRNLYIRPFRLYITMVVVHFLILTVFASGDFFNVEKFPAFEFPVFREPLEEARNATTLPPEKFNAEVSQKLKDNLSVIIYFVVFFAACLMSLIYWRRRQYFVEHLYFVFHLFSFSLLRNIVLVPLYAAGLPPIVIMGFAAVTQIGYTFLSLRTVYAESNRAALGKTALFLGGVAGLLLLAAFLSLLMAIQQLGGQN